MPIYDKRDISPIALWQGNDVASNWNLFELVEYATNSGILSSNARFNIAYGSFTIPVAGTPKDEILGFSPHTVIYYFLDSTASPTQHHIGFAAGMSAYPTQPTFPFYFGNMDSTTSTIEAGSNDVRTYVPTQFYTIANGFRFLNSATPPTVGGDSITYIAFGD